MSDKYFSPTDYLLTNINDQILTITLNRPDALNALRPEMLDGIRNLIEETEMIKIFLLLLLRVRVELFLLELI